MLGGGLQADSGTACSVFPFWITLAFGLQYSHLHLNINMWMEPVCSTSAELFCVSQARKYLQKRAFYPSVEPSLLVPLQRVQPSLLGTASSRTEGDVLQVPQQPVLLLPCLQRCWAASAWAELSQREQEAVGRERCVADTCCWYVEEGEESKVLEEKCCLVVIPQ